MLLLFWDTLFTLRFWIDVSFYLSCFQIHSMLFFKGCNLICHLSFLLAHENISLQVNRDKICSLRPPSKSKSCRPWEKSHYQFDKGHGKKKKIRESVCVHGYMQKEGVNLLFSPLFPFLFFSFLLVKYQCLFCDCYREKKNVPEDSLYSFCPLPDSVI